MNFGARGVVRCQVLRKDSSIKLDTGEFNNLLLDGFFDRALTKKSLSASITTGSGSTEPVVTDTSLVSVISPLRPSTSTKADEEFKNDLSTNVATAYVEWEFIHDTGEVVGNISEFGFALSGGSSQNSLDSRVLIKDDSGNPTTLTILADEQLVVTYRLEVSMSTNPAGEVSTVVINGVSHTVTALLLDGALSKKAKDVYYYGPNLTSYPWFCTNSSNVVPEIFSSVYAVDKKLGKVNQYKKDRYTLYQGGVVPISDGNYAGGIGVITLPFPTGGRIFGYFFDPKIPKTSSDTFAVGFETKLGRA